MQKNKAERAGRLGTGAKFAKVREQFKATVQSNEYITRKNR